MNSHFWGAGQQTCRMQHKISPIESELQENPGDLEKVFLILAEKAQFCSESDKSTMNQASEHSRQVALFASGTGSNAVKIIEHLRAKYSVSFTIYVNQWKEGKPRPGILEKAKALGLPARVFTRKELKAPEGVLKQLQAENTDLIVLAGFLWLMPSHIVQAYEGGIVNIHPSLLPRYGGKGMFGSREHQAVKEQGDAKTGITIHYVNEHYDEGAVILQAAAGVSPSDGVGDIAQKVQALEHRYFPLIVEDLLLER